MTTPDQPRPLSGNRAFQRLYELVDDAFDAVCWLRTTGEPFMLNLVDPASGDTITLRPLDGFDTSPTAVLTADDDWRLRLVPGPTAANALVARHTATHDSPMACAAPVHPPHQPHLPEHVWIEVPEQVAANIAGPAADNVDPATSVVVLLLDRTAAEMVLVGPFETVAEADRWRSTPLPDRPVQRMVLPVSVS